MGPDSIGEVEYLGSLVMCALSANANPLPARLLRVEKGPGDRRSLRRAWADSRRSGESRGRLPTIQYISSYFFREPTHLVSTEFRGRPTVERDTGTDSPALPTRSPWPS